LIAINVDIGPPPAEAASLYQFGFNRRLPPLACVLTARRNGAVALANGMS